VRPRVSELAGGAGERGSGGPAGGVRCVQQQALPKSSAASYKRASRSDQLRAGALTITLRYWECR
jgi:hypothetical protein